MSSNPVAPIPPNWEFLLELSEAEFSDLRSKFSTAKFAKTRVLPNAFTAHHKEEAQQMMCCTCSDMMKPQDSGKVRV